MAININATFNSFVKYKGKSDEEMADIAAGMYGDVEDVAREEFDGMAEAKRGKFVEYVEGEGV